MANTLAAVEQGFTHVQGCINGYGERCGNANLTSIIANLELKLGHTTIGPEKLTNLTAVARYIAELANLPHAQRSSLRRAQRVRAQGRRARERRIEGRATYEHMKPETGRQPPARAGQRSFRPRQASCTSSSSTGLADRLDEDARRELLERIKQMEYQGYELEAAEGTFELLVREALHPGLHFFEVVNYEVTTRAGGRLHGDGHVAHPGRSPFGHRQRATVR